VASLPRTATLLLRLTPVAALAAANHIPQWSLATDKDVQRTEHDFGFTTSGKLATWPKKIEIPSFLMHYDTTQTEANLTTTTV
jgi:hypothetical protein